LKFYKKTLYAWHNCQWQLRWIKKPGRLMKILKKYDPYGKYPDVYFFVIIHHF